MRPLFFSFPFLFRARKRRARREALAGETLNVPVSLPFPVPRRRRRILFTGPPSLSPATGGEVAAARLQSRSKINASPLFSDKPTGRPPRPRTGPLGDRLAGPLRAYQGPRPGPCRDRRPEDEKSRTGANKSAQKKIDEVIFVDWLHSQLENPLFAGVRV
jgi:hypothetical protein